MLSLLFTTLMAASLGPMGPDAPAHEPQIATSGSGSQAGFAVPYNLNEPLTTPRGGLCCNEGHQGGAAEMELVGRFCLRRR